MRLLQITDSHLYADPEQCLAGVNTQKSFISVLDGALTQFSNPDLILATGDLVHDASKAGYRRLGKAFEQTGVPTYCLAGNHDDPTLMADSITAAHISFPKTAIWGNWLLVLLNSSQPPHPGGHLGGDELAALQQSLESHPNHHALICMHHHPVPMGSRWVDNIALDNPLPFFAIIDRHPRVKGVLWGHVHQIFDDLRNGVKLMGTPSTCIQFNPNQDDFAIEKLPPGYRWLELMPDGRINSGVERLEKLPQGLDIGLSGY